LSIRIIRFVLQYSEYQAAKKFICISDNRNEELVPALYIFNRIFDRMHKPRRSICLAEMTPSFYEFEGTRAYSASSSRFFMQNTSAAMPVQSVHSRPYQPAAPAEVAAATTVTFDKNVVRIIAKVRMPLSSLFLMLFTPLHKIFATIL